MEQNKESEERDLSLTESDYVLIRMVVAVTVKQLILQLLLQRLRCFAIIWVTDKF